MVALMPSFTPGFRLIDGSDLNEMAEAIDNIQGNGTPAPGTFTTVAASGAITPTGGVAPVAGVATNVPFQIPNISVGSVAYGSLGTAVSCVAGTIYIASVFLPANKTLTGIGVLNAGTVGTSLGIVGLYNSAGVLLANSALAGAVTAGANAFQQRAFTATYNAVGPAVYYIAYQANNNTDNIRTIAASTFLGVLTKGTAGVFGTLGAQTAPTTFTADVGPIGYLY